MSAFEELEEELRRVGWRFDPGNEEFMDGDRPVEWIDVLLLVPGMTIDEMRAWEEDQVDKFVARNWGKPD